MKIALAKILRCVFCVSVVASFFGLTNQMVPLSNSNVADSSVVSMDIHTLLLGPVEVSGSYSYAG